MAEQGLMQMWLSPAETAAIQMVLDSPPGEHSRGVGGSALADYLLLLQVIKAVARRKCARDGDGRRRASTDRCRPSKTGRRTTIGWMSGCYGGWIRCGITSCYTRKV
jgi:hypothetical protein